MSLEQKQFFESGRRAERERIIALIREVWESRCSPVLEPDECSICWITNSLITIIEGENE